MRSSSRPSSRRPSLPVALPTARPGLRWPSPGYTRSTVIPGEWVRAMIQSGVAHSLYAVASDVWKGEHKALSALYVAGTFDPESNATIEKFVAAWVYPLEGSSAKQKVLLRAIAARNKEVPCLARISAFVDSDERGSLVDSFRIMGNRLLDGQANILGGIGAVDTRTKWVLLLQLVMLAVLVAAIAVLAALVCRPDVGQLLPAHGNTPVGLYIALAAAAVFIVMAFVAYRCCRPHRGQ